MNSHWTTYMYSWNEEVDDWSDKIDVFINPLLLKSDLKILVCLMPVDFTRQRETPQGLKG